MNASSYKTPEARFEEVTAVVTRVAASLGMTLTFTAGTSSLYRHAYLAKDGIRHEIVVESAGVQFRKGSAGRRGYRCVTTALSDANVRHHLEEVLAIMNSRAEAERAADAKDAERAENIAKAKVARGEFVASMNAAGITTDSVRRINFLPVRDADAFGPMPHFDRVDDGSFGVSIFRPGRIVFSISYSRAEMSAQFSADSAPEAVRIIKGFDAIFAK